MRSPIRISLAAATAAFTLAACGGGDKSADPSAAPAATTPSATVASATPNVDSIGRAVYATCTTCHMVNGEGVTGAFPPLAGSSIVTGPPEIPVAIVLHGMMGPLTVKGVKYDGMMTPWGPMFNDVQVAAVVTYIRSQWGNSAPAVEPELVARVRAAHASRTAMWTWDELQKATF
jgi:mono/diheme cytochrome c family protein